MQCLPCDGHALEQKSYLKCSMSLNAYQSCVHHPNGSTQRHYSLQMSVDLKAPSAKILK